MTTYGEPRVWLDEFPLGEPQPFAVDYHGLRYPGEIIRAQGWQPAWGEPLTSDVYFRIVLLLRRQGAGTPRNISIWDNRIAVCLPGAGLSRQRGRLSEEIATIRETQALYLTQRDAEVDLIRSTLRRRQEGLEQQLLAEESIRYSSGNILTGPDRPSYPGNPFSAVDPISWFSEISGWLLSQAYPSLPVDEDSLSRPVTQEDPEALYQAIFAQSAATTGILAELGPALGLTPGDLPRVFEPSSCRVFDLIREQLSSRPGPVSWSQAHNHLAHQIGLTRPLATLYLLCYLYQERSELELGLASDHHLATVDGITLPGNRLTGDLIPHLSWDGRIADWATTIGPVTQPHWNDTLVYLSRLSPGLTTVEEDAGPQEQALLRDIRRLAEEVGQGQGFLSLLRTQATEGEAAVTAENIIQCMTRLSAITGDGFLEVYRSVRQVYAGYGQLEEDLHSLQRLNGLARFKDELQSAWEYLDGAAVPWDLSDLSLQKKVVGAALSPNALLRFTHHWTELSRRISDFKSPFASAYRSHHQSWQDLLPAYLRDMEEGRRKLRALDLLNTLSELGEATGVGLSQGLDQLVVETFHCSVLAADVELEAVPWCPSCHLSLAQELPTERLARLLSAIDGELGDKNRRLSNLVVEKILRGHVDQRVEDFLKIVLASDLHALSNTISEELVGFVRRMLEQP